MNIDKLEIWIHDNILKNDTIRHFVYGTYQRALWLISPKFKTEGNITRITPDDGYEYLFGYYDKSPWSYDGRYMLALKVKNASLHADSTEKAEIIRIDLQKDNKAETIAVTYSWNVQQGCMMQWLDNNTILYNDCRNKRYCSVILNLDTGEERIINMPVYTVSADHEIALSLDFSRLHRLRPGYGYANLAEETKNQKCPDSTCIWKIELKTGHIQPVLKYTDFYNFQHREDMTGAEHKVNHLMLSPDGKRFMVLHRWFKNKVKYTRLVTCNIDGTEMYNLSDDNFVSHCYWKNNEEIISYLNKENGGKGYYILKDKSVEYKRIWTQLNMDGHPSCSDDEQFVVTDTYPDRRRIQSIYIMSDSKVNTVARVFSPFKYKGNTRCDLHPRWSRDGKQICFDASFEGKRGVYIVKPASSLLESHTASVTSNKPKISVIIPCYNCEDLVSETLNALENQTYKNFEVVCVNDGSKDKTLEVLQNYKKKSALNINIIDQENGGVSVARNRGIKESRGEYILFCDSDDLYHNQFVELLISALKDTNADVSYCKHSREADKALNTKPKGNWQQKTQNEAMKNLLYRMGEISFACYLYNANILRSHSIIFDENTKFGEDREFNWKYICHCQTAAFVNETLYWYRANKNSATKGSASWRKTDLLSAVKRIEQYLEENECEFHSEFCSYMYARSMWAVAKTFASSGSNDLYKRLRKEYDVRNQMKTTFKDKNKLVKLASFLYLIHPSLFYYVIRIMGRIF